MNKKIDRLDLGLSVATGLMVGAEGMHFFSARLPSAMTIQKFADNPQDLASLQQGLVEATVLSLGTAGAVSGIYKWVKLKYWWIPFVTNVFMTAIMVSLYWNDIQLSMKNGSLRGIQNINAIGKGGGRPPR